MDDDLKEKILKHYEEKGEQAIKEILQIFSISQRKIDNAEYKKVLDKLKALVKK